MENNQDRKTYVWVSLIVALIGGVCLIIAAFIEISPNIPSWRDLLGISTEAPSTENNPTVPTILVSTEKVEAEETEPAYLPLSCKSGEFAPADVYSFYSFSTELGSSDFVYGQCSSFKGGGITVEGGVAYLILGPGDFSWSTMHGWWDICSGGTPEEIQNRLEWQATSLEENNNTSTGIARRVICNIENGSMVCRQE
jgi:hypothetical protein